MEKSIMHHQVVKCPECGKDIVLNWPRAEAMTHKQFKERVQKLLKEEEG